MINLINNPTKIVNSFTEDDGTTLGKKVHVDNLGGQWVKARSSSACQTTINDTRTIDRNGYFVNYANAN